MTGRDFCLTPEFKGWLDSTVIGYSIAEFAAFQTAAFVEVKGLSSIKNLMIRQPQPILSQPFLPPCMVSKPPFSTALNRARLGKRIPFGTDLSKIGSPWSSDRCSWPASWCNYPRTFHTDIDVKWRHENSVCSGYIPTSVEERVTVDMIQGTILLNHTLCVERE